MSREAMKLALEALEYSIDLVEEDYANAVSLYGKYPSRAQRLIGMETMRDDHRKAITVLREALAKPDFWEGYVPEPVRPAQQALDKKAENARELGLDYEPVWGGGPTNKDYEDAMRLRRLNELAKPAQRKWQGLTDEEIWETVSRIGTSDSDVNPYAKLADARAIEAKLRSKNEDRN